MIDYLIVGQGIAGTCIARKLLAHSKTIKIVDNLHKHASSKVAAGIVNPITGRYYVKSWLIDDLLPYAKSFYEKYERAYGIDILEETSVLRTIPDIKHENDWFARKMDPSYAPYLAEKPEWSQWLQYVHPSFSLGQIHSALKVNVPKFILHFRQVMNDLFITENFEYDQVQINKDHIGYKGLKAKNIIFCEGYKVLNNPFFRHLPFQPVKGEALHIKMSGPIPKSIFRGKQFICPVDDYYWVGAGYDRKTQDEKTTLLERERMKSLLQSRLKMSYEVINQVAGVRPSSIDRRPILGTHPKYLKVHLFNGMGTKGTSLAPYWADKMVNYLENHEELNTHVSLHRFQ